MNEHFIVVFSLEIYPYLKQKAFQFMTYELYRRDTPPPPPPPPICLLGPLRTEKHLWRRTSAAIAVAMVTGITICL